MDTHSGRVTKSQILWGKSSRKDNIIRDTVYYPAGSTYCVSSTSVSKKQVFMNN